MRRIILMVIRCLYILPFWFWRICQFAKDKDYQQYSLQERYDYICKIVKKVNRIGNVTVESSGLENIPNEDGFIMYPNHQGMFDVLAIMDQFPRAYSVILKKEVENVILVKQMIETFHYIPMDRSNMKQSAKAILEVTKRVKAGENFLIFAEGTRSKFGNEILAFKAGAFKAATKAKAPIVPVALMNSFMPFDKNTTKPVTVYVHYLEPIYYEEYAGMNTTEIAMEVEKRIRAYIQSH